MVLFFRLRFETLVMAAYRSPELQIFKSPYLTEPKMVTQWSNARNLQASLPPPLALLTPHPYSPSVYNVYRAVGLNTL